MKVAIYVPSWPPGSSANGIVTYAAQVVPALRRLGHEVFVLTSSRAGPGADRYTIDLEEFSGTRSIWHKIKSRLSSEQAFHDAFSDKIVSAVAMLKGRHGIEVIEIEESFGWSLSIARSNLIPVVVRLHGPWFLNGGFDSSSKASFRTRIGREGRGIGAASIVTAPSADVLDRVRREYALPLARARVIANPIGISSDEDAWQLEECNQNTMLFVGRFDRRKGGDIVLKAFMELAERNSSLRLCFVGPDKGIQDADGERLSFDQFVRKHLPETCWHRIEYHGQLPNREVMALRRKCFLTIVASQFEILPYAVLEAMSSGCPIIASRVGGIPELIIDGQNGLLFESQNAEELSAACQKLLDNHSLAISLGSQARKDCAASFNADNIAVDVVAAYQYALDLHSHDRLPAT